MIRKHKGALILSSLAVLFPTLVGLTLRSCLPEARWGVVGQGDGFVIFALPLSLLAAHWLCILITAKDPHNQDQNWKPIRLVLWIMPVLSNICAAMLYALALG